MSNDSALAIHGGDPVSDDTIPYHRPSIGEAEITEAGKAIESKYVVGPGPYCEKVEKHLEAQWNVPRVLTTTNCTHAMEMALLTADLNPEDEVIVPSFTYVSTAQAVIRAGATPVFADVDPDTLTLTPETIEPHLSERTRGVLMVHYGGFPGPIEAIQAFCEERNLFCLEDAAQCFGATRKGRAAGTVGRFGAVSFHGTKSLTCGEGGILIVNHEEDVQRAEMIRDKGTDRSSEHLGDEDRYTWRSVGSSYVLSDILGAVLWRQIQRWETIKEERKKVQDKVREGVREIDPENYFELIEPPEHAEENGHLTAFTIPWPEHRDWLLEALQAEGIQAREHYHPLNLSPYARNHLNPPDSLPSSERISASLVRLPAHPEMDDADIESVIEAIKKIYPSLPPATD